MLSVVDDASMLMLVQGHTSQRRKRFRNNTILSTCRREDLDADVR